MNKHIELVKKWLDDPDSVTADELKDNATEVAYLGYVADAAAYAANLANNAAKLKNADEAKRYVKKYEEPDDVEHYVKKYEGLTEEKDNE